VLLHQLNIWKIYWK